MSKRKLLLADDSVTIQKVVNLTFADEGIEVISVGDGDSAMEKVAEVSPDLIMADVNMPGLTGYEICERIRQDDNLRRTPVILLVGSFEPFDEDEARRVGADDYLTKPFQSIRQLVNKVTVLLDTKNGENGDGTNNASSLEDTLEMDVSEIAENVNASPKFEDTGFDDEMIQTNQPTGFAFDETQKFESRETGELSNPSQFEGYDISEKDDEASLISENETEFINDEVLETQTIKPEINDYKDDFIASESDSYELIEEEYQADTKSDHEISYEIKEPEETVYEITDEDSKTSELNHETESISEYSAENYYYETDDKDNVSYEIKDDSDIEMQGIEENSETINESDEKLEKVEESSDDSVESEAGETVVDIQENEGNSDYSETESALEKIEEKSESLDEPQTEEFINADEETLEKTGESNYGYSVEMDEISSEDSIDSDINKETEIIETVSAEELGKEEVDSDVVKDYEFASEDSNEITQIGDSSENVDAAHKTAEEEIPLPEFASVLELDDDDILQLPPFENELEIESPALVDEKTNISSPDRVSFASETKNNERFDATSISEEFIELIVAKVLERLSDKAVKEVAWEVVPHLTEVIVKKMAEEKLKD